MGSMPRSSINLPKYPSNGLLFSSATAAEPLIPVSCSYAEMMMTSQITSPSATRETDDVMSACAKSRQLAIESALIQMNDRIDQRRTEWDVKVERLKQDFFSRPMWSSTSSLTSSLPAHKQHVRGVGDVPNASSFRSNQDRQTSGSIPIPLSTPATATSPLQFQVTLDVSQYEPNEITVRTDDHRHLIVECKRRQSGLEPKTTVSRQFNRQVDIPRNIDPSHLRCTLNNGLLVIELDPTVTSTNQLKSPVASAVAAPVLPRAYSNAASGRSTSDTSVVSRTTMTPSNAGGHTIAHVSTGPFVTDPNGNKRFQVCVDVGAEFDHNELTVKTVDRKLYVTARHMEAAPGSRRLMVSREMNREFELPSSVNPETVTAHLSDEGQLVIEAPLSQSTSPASPSSSPSASGPPSPAVRL